MGRTLLQGARLVVVAALVGLAGCDLVANKTLRVGQDTEADVRQLMGKPEMIWEDDSGARRLEYPRGGNGMGGAATWFVYVDKDGKYQGMEQAMQDKFFRQVEQGMARDDVRRLLGQPTEKMTYPLSGEEVWSWRYLDDTSDPAFFHVHFDAKAGLVRRTTRGVDVRNQGA